jgi:hypothetical protein
MYHVSKYSIKSTDTARTEPGYCFFVNILAEILRAETDKKTRMFPIVKEIPRKRIKVTSSLKKQISTDHLGNSTRRGGGVTPAALTPFHYCGRIHRSCMGIKASLKVGFKGGVNGV